MLTAAQRLHVDVNGYVLLKQVFTREECCRFAEIAVQMQSDSRLPRRDLVGQTVLYGPAWYDRCVLDVAMSDRLRPAAEQIVGGEARLEENQFLIFHPIRDGAAATSCAAKIWHRGLKPDHGSFESGGHYHCLLTKTLTYLTYNDSATGTWVVPGSHRMSCNVDAIATVLDDSLVRFVAAEPGDVLVFGETLIHCSPLTTLTTDRILMVVAYCAPYMKPWSGDADPPGDFRAALTDEQKRFVYGDGRYAFRSG